MLYAELNTEGRVTGITNVDSPGMVSCEGLTAWQIDHQGDLRFVGGTWDVSQVPAEPQPEVPVVYAPGSPEDIAQRKANLVPILVKRGYAEQDATAYAEIVLY